MWPQFLLRHWSGSFLFWPAERLSLLNRSKLLVICHTEQFSWIQFSNTLFCRRPAVIRTRILRGHYESKGHHNQRNLAQNRHVSSDRCHNGSRRMDPREPDDVTSSLTLHIRSISKRARQEIFGNRRIGRPSKDTQYIQEFSICPVERFQWPFTLRVDFSSE